MDAKLQAQYAALTSGAGLVDCCGRTLIEMSGADAASHLHSFCTNDINSLVPGKGCEAFITSAQGKILGHVLVQRQPQALVLETECGQAEKLIGHLDRYVLRADVALHDRSSEWGELLLAGAGSEALLQRRTALALPQQDLAGADATLDRRPVYVVRVDRLTGRTGFLLRAVAADVPPLKHFLLDAGAVLCGVEAFDAVRIEAGWPMYGRDITEQNLPQEVDRNAQAISFKKGCYLGQETVARIDALGHVNRKLCGLKFSGDSPPAPGTLLMAGDKQVGEVTSAAMSPQLGAPLALGYVRRGHNDVGTRLSSSAGEAEVVVNNMASQQKASKQ